MKPKVIFFLGNGFSQSLGFPSMAELWEQCLDQPNIFPESIEKAKRRYPLSYFLENDYNDLELLLTVWQAAWENHEKQFASSWAQSGRGDFELFVANICDKLDRTGRAITERRYAEFQIFLTQLVQDYRVTFITTNYDLVVESLLKRIRVPYTLRGEGTSDQIPLRKLHGSISWFSSKYQIGLATGTLQPFFTSRQRDQLVYDLTDHVFTTGYQNVHLQRGQQLFPTNITPIPTLIPPLVGKTYHEFFLEIFDDIQHDFEAFDHLIIVGYSFPEADPFVRDHLTSLPFKQRDGARQITFIDPDNHTCNRAKHYFANKIETKVKAWEVDDFRAVVGNANEN